eukprot:8694841-Pyramimonas_sp.AAC.1
MPRRSQSNANAMPMKGIYCCIFKTEPCLWRVSIGIVLRRGALELASATPKPCQFHAKPTPRRSKLNASATPM